MFETKPSQAEPKVGPLAADNGDIADDSTKMADEFNKFLSLVFTDEDTTNTPTCFLVGWMEPCMM